VPELREVHSDGLKRLNGATSGNIHALVQKEIPGFAEEGHVGRIEEIAWAALLLDT
jgi:hypothetical protein